MVHQLRDSWLRGPIDFDNNWKLFRGLVSKASLASSNDKPELQCRGRKLLPLRVVVSCVAVVGRVPRCDPVPSELRGDPNPEHWADERLPLLFLQTSGGIPCLWSLTLLSQAVKLAHPGDMGQEDMVAMPYRGVQSQKVPVELVPVHLPQELTPVNRVMEMFNLRS